MIGTFYSYKGGVGRSMALANIADLLARSGLRVLMVDFDLEAPGLEHFFPVSGDWVRGREGLLDLLLAYRYSMSAVSSGSEERDAFRDLDRYITTIYPDRPESGCLDLLSAGQRRTDDQLLSYGLELRQFDWLDFYFNWSGELFFEWFRKTATELYDIVLVDSRTGVTEMGGICAYQLADVVIAFCAPNLQNVDGTETMVRHFLSPSVTAVRRDRPIDVLVVPARIEQEDSTLSTAFERRFEERFAAFQPAALTDAGLTFWDLRIPYEPRYAFDEQVVTDPDRAEERRGLAASYGHLLSAIALLAPSESPIAAQRPVETRYDPTTRFAPPDVLIGGDPAAADTGRELAGMINAELTGVRAEFVPRQQATVPVTRSKSVLALVGGGPGSRPWHQREVEQFASLDGTVISVLLPGAWAIDCPPGPYLMLDFREGIDRQELLRSVRTMLGEQAARRGPVEESARIPYVGLVPFSERDSSIFFGRDSAAADMLSQLASHSICLVGAAGIGKTSLVQAGLIPALRSGALPESEHWSIALLRPGRDPMPALARQITRLTGHPPVDPAAIRTWLRERDGRMLLVVDQMEELFTAAAAPDRYQFIRYLRQLIGEEAGPDSRIRLVLVLRADFVSSALQYEFLTDRHLSFVTLGPIGADKLRDAIEGPAAASGLALEPGLAERLIADTADAPGALPLLQFALRALWERRQGGYLTHSGYEETGGVQEALARRVEQTLSGLSPAERKLARRLLLRLITVADDEARSRGPVDMYELTSAFGSPGSGEADVEALILRLTGHRLLVSSSSGQGTQVELAHEALVHTPPVTEWIADTRSGLMASSRLTEAAAEWLAHDRDSSLLLSPSRVRVLASDMEKIDFPMSSIQSSYVRAAQHAYQAGTVRTIFVAGVVITSASALLAASAVTGFNVVIAAIAAAQLGLLLPVLVNQARRR
jgi:cellulose biosynthesis protein BcsQ